MLELCLSIIDWVVWICQRLPFFVGLYLLCEPSGKYYIINKNGVSDNSGFAPPSLIVYIHLGKLVIIKILIAVFLIYKNKYKPFLIYLNIVLYILNIATILSILLRNFIRWYGFTK